jgi:TonB family protein
LEMKADSSRKSALILACLLGVGLSAQEAFSPARYQAGTVPALPVMAVGGGQVLLELAVSREGRVTTVSPLRTTPPFTDLVVGAVRDWRFAPAEDDVQTEPSRSDKPAPRKPVPSTILVAAVFRQPALYGPTLGETPRDVASASAETAFPLMTTVPPFPPSALNSGVVLVEAQVDRNGAVTAGTVIHSAPPFDDAALTAARQWSFRPARVRGTAVTTRVYILFGFPIPVVNVPPAPASPPRRDPARPGA